MLYYFCLYNCYLILCINLHSKEVIIISTREIVNNRYNNYLEKVNSFIKRKEITITFLTGYLGVKKRDTVYAYLNGTHIIPYDKVLLLDELMSQESSR